MEKPRIGLFDSDVRNASNVRNDPLVLHPNQKSYSCSTADGLLLFLADYYIWTIEEHVGGVPALHDFHDQFIAIVKFIENQEHGMHYDSKFQVWDTLKGQDDNNGKAGIGKCRYHDHQQSMRCNNAIK